MFGFGKTFENYTKYLSNDETEKVLDLLDSSEKVFFDPLVLHYACYYKNYEVIKFLLSKDKSPYAIDDQGYSPLHYLTNMGDLGKFHRSKDTRIVHTDFGLSHQKFYQSFDLRILDLFKIYKNIFYIQNESIINQHYLHFPIDLSFSYDDIEAIKYFLKLGVDLNKLCKKRNKNGVPKKFDKDISSGVNLYFGILMDNAYLGLHNGKHSWSIHYAIHRLLIKKGYKFNITKAASYASWNQELYKKETDFLIKEYRNIKNYC